MNAIIRRKESKLKVLFEGWRLLQHSYGQVTAFQLIHLWKLYGPNGKDVGKFLKQSGGGNPTTIGKQAFEGCTSLTSITFSEGLETIGEQAFGDCMCLTSIIFPSETIFFHKDHNDLIHRNINNYDFSEIIKKEKLKERL